MTDSNQRIDFAEVFKSRTKKFVVDNIKFFRTLPKTEEAKSRQATVKVFIFGWCQLQGRMQVKIKGGVSSKLLVVVEEADESVFWMEILTEAGIVQQSELEYLYDEANQILKIVSASRKTVSKNK